MTPAEHRESATQHIRAAVIELHQVGIPYDQIIGTVAGYARRHLHRDLCVLTDHQRHILQTLADVGPVSARDLAPPLGICPTSARRHMVKLQNLGLVDAVTRLRKYWRGIFNERVWHVTKRGYELLKTED